jgi:hypothetical protein
VGSIKHFPEVELWLQRPADIVRKVKDDAAQVMSEPVLPLKAVCYSRSDCTSE